MVNAILANVGRGVSVPVAKRNIIKIRRAMQTDPIVFWNEIDEADLPDEHRLIRQVFRPRYDHAGWEGKEPISIPKLGFDLTSERRRAIMQGVPREAPGGASPTRFLTIGIIEPSTLMGEEVVLINTHFPNFPVDDPRWKQCWEMLEDEVNDQARKGRAGVWAGDVNSNFNRYAPPLMGKERRVIAKGNDQMGVWNSKDVHVRVHGTFSINMTIDGHDAHGARLDFRRR